MKVSLDHIKQETSDIFTFFFKPETYFKYVAGQFIEMTLPHDNPDARGIKHWFTLSSAPGQEVISITTRRAEKSSTFKKTLFAKKPGDIFEISEPMGDFVLPVDENTPLVFVAGGIGITPYHSMIEWLVLNKQKRKIQMIYSAHSNADLVFKELLSQDYIDIIYWTNKDQLTVDKIIELVDGISGKQVYLSGPEPMIESFVDQFKELGITQNQLITDYFPGYSAVL